MAVAAAAAVVVYVRGTVVVCTLSLAREVAVPAEFIAVHWYQPASVDITRSNCSDK